jgi:hypothetical protein
LNLRGAELRLLLRRHVFLVGEREPNAADELACFGLAWDDGGTAFAAGEQGVDGVDAEFALLFLGAVAGRARVGEDGLGGAGAGGVRG